MIINILKIVKIAGINIFFNTTDELVKSYEYKGNSFIITLNLFDSETWKVNDNFEDFKKVLEKLLFIFNNNTELYYKNISFNKIKIWDETYNNSIFLYNSEQNISWYFQIKWVIKFPARKEPVWKDIYDKIYDLAKNDNLSIRNLMKLWIKQTKARNIYTFLKENKIIVISKNNNNDKKYDLDKLSKFLKIAKNKNSV